MSDLITAEVSDRICQHMNEDHGEAIVLYAKTFGNMPLATKAQMISIDPEGMNLSVIKEDETFSLRIKFDHTLAHSEDAHQTLIEMVKQARKMS
jgi:putative heme iron utilization protein